MRTRGRSELRCLKMTNNRHLLDSDEVHYRIAKHYATGKAVAVCVQWFDYYHYTFLNEDCYAEEWEAQEAEDRLNGVIIDRDTLAALPLGSVVKAHWEDGSQRDMLVMRSDNGSAASSGYAVAGMSYWTGMSCWGAKLTVLYRGEGDV